MATEDNSTDSKESDPSTEKDASTSNGSVPILTHEVMGLLVVVGMIIVLLLSAIYANQQATMRSMKTHVADMGVKCAEMTRLNKEMFVEHCGHGRGPPIGEIMLPFIQATVITTAIALVFVAAVKVCR